MNICVFCGSATGNNPQFADAATYLGKLLAENGHSLVYGGAKIGIMGLVADAVLANSGKVFGILPGFLAEKEVAHTGLTQLEIVGTMHERKMRMAELADAFVALPGGWGTLEELAEILTWKQLGLIHQPVFLLNTNGFYNGLLGLFNSMITEGFLRETNLAYLQMADSPEKILSSLSKKG
jgi:uncharacterized protein (TIGR00730 family)